MKNSFTCFAGNRRLASGSLVEAAVVAKRATSRGDSILIFEDATGETTEVDLRGSDEEMLARLSQTNGGTEPRGRGRPKLGVVAREVTLLPRHWEWLATQPGGASVALRKLVEEARRGGGDREKIRRAQERAYRFMSTIAGDFPGFEEASRALFAQDADKFRKILAAWPPDVCEHALRLAASEEP